MSVSTGEIAAQVILYGGALAAVGAMLRWLWRASKTLHRLADDLLGDDERPSVSARLAVIEAEMHPNHGSSLRDAVDRVEQRLEDHIHSHSG